MILEVYLDLKMYFIYTVYFYRMKKPLHLNFCCLFFAQKTKILYSGDLVIVDTVLGTTAIYRFDGIY